MDNYRPKIEHTMLYEGSNENTLVTPGELILVKHRLLPAEVYIDNGKDGRYPIVVAKNQETIDKGDWAYNTKYNMVFQWTQESKKFDKKNARKVIVLPESLSDNHKNLISTGRLQQNDEVFIQCHEAFMGRSNGPIYETRVKINNRRKEGPNTVNLYKKDDTADQIYELYKKMEPCPLKDHLDEWFGLHTDNINDKQ